MNFPKVTIILPTWLEKNKRYLDLAIESIRNLNYPKEQIETILIGRKSYKPEYDGVLSIAPYSDEFANPVGVNFGAKHASPDSKYLLLFNDDAILTKNSILKMVELSELNSAPLVLNGISPCDSWLYAAIFQYKKDGQIKHVQKKFTRYEDFVGDFKEMMDADSVYAPMLWTQVPFLCLYASMVPRNLWNELGGFNENFETSADDLDFCHRAMQAGAQLAVATNVLIWHFGGVTSSETMTYELRKKSARVYRDYYGHWPPGVDDAFMEK